MIKRTDAVRIVLIALAALGLLLLIFGERISASFVGNDAERKNAYHQNLAAQTEERIRKICENVRGVGNAEVAVTLSEGEAGMEKIDGIGIVCDGGENAKIRREVTELLSAAFAVPSNKIYVTASKT